MESSLSTVSLPVRPDVVGVETMPRPTPEPAHVSFAEVLAGGARALVQGAQAAASVLPGSPLMAVALRGRGGASLVAPVSAAPLSPMRGSVGVAGGAPEGPGGNLLGGGILGSEGVGGAPGAVGPDGGGSDGLSTAMTQDQEMNLYYLSIQERVNADNRRFSALSNVLEVEHNTAKTAIGNIR